MADSLPVSSLPSDSVKSHNRVDWIDYAKGIGILLVVVGHTLRGLVSSSILEASIQEQAVDKWIYAFHMPLFFFISGLFIERSASKSLKAFLVNKLLTIAYPYFIWSILQELIRRLTGVNSEPEPIVNIWRILYDPVMQFWFLYVLFIFSLGYAILRKLGLSVKAFVFVSCLLYVAHLVGINFGSWGVLYMLRIQVIYFALGILVAETKLLSQLNKLTSIHLIITAISGFLIIAIAVLLNVAQLNIFVVPLAFIGIFSSLSLAIFLQQFAFTNFFKNWGILSLQIFVAHTIFSAGGRIFLQKIFHLSIPSVHIIVGVLMGIYGSIGLYLICQKFNFPYAFTLPPLKVK